MGRRLWAAAIALGIGLGVAYAVTVSLPRGTDDPASGAVAPRASGHEDLAPLAADRCAAAADVFGNGSLAAAFDATAEEVASWQERKHQMVNPPIRAQLGPTAPVTVCYFDGDFGPARGPAGFDIADYDRIVVLIGPDGKPHLYVSGHQGSFGLEDPRAP
jgi:hypothetical protein